MGSPRKTKDVSSRLLGGFLAGFPLDWITLLFELYRGIHLWLNHQRHEGLYENLEYDAIWELIDSEGQTAIFKKHQRVKFLQDEINSFTDYGWGEGDTFAKYSCSPGRMVDKYQDGDRWNILISLQETKSAGDVTDFHIRRTIKNGFTKDKEWVQTEIRHKCKRLKMSIIFPKERECKRAVLEERSRHRTTVLGPAHFTNLPDGRQMLTWETKKLRIFEVYTIRWKW